MLLLLKALYFFLPAYFANMAPVIFKKVPVLSKPISKKLFGKNKTWRGLVSAVLVGFLVYLVQVLLYRFSLVGNGFFWIFLQEISLINYLEYSLLLGFFLSLGAILGDIFESYIKRKLGFKPGQSWFPFDQLDFVVGALLLSMLIYFPDVLTIILLLSISPLLHLTINYVAYFLGIREVKY
ncbi:CDP-archaeol synthase [archaeon]|jgi:CDP-2,3-bis-(O-geranylgeranyl)-sn-glycerol synthase|nr:CDP-archaeol synthase [archaeon]MBT3450420.1 CDP-archaeol synthase [archaeon]MBT6869163.1 CDP-archaeol synthase [archaeon]MBT7192810.1 CDP-archaeol synthase [archaeon]MBT7381350.1 CDP-archaeol synthase [archaeon]